MMVNVGNEDFEDATRGGEITTTTFTTGPTTVWGSVGRIRKVQ